MDLHRGLSDQDVGDLATVIRREEARTIALQVISRRAKGEVVPDEAVIAQHLRLMPELAVELEAVRQVQQAVVAAHKVGAESRNEQILSAEELERPITLSGAGRAMVSPRRVSVTGYAILDEIGRGGQAVVYRGKQIATGRSVALKVMSGSELVNPTYRARFDREVKVLAVLDHPNIVSILDCGRTDQEAFYLVTELVDGAELDGFAAECRAFDESHPKLLLTVLAKVARAVQAAHDEGVIHRDLKPSNIRVDRRNEPRILDFGLAKAAETDRALTVEGQWIGSIPWFSPEMASQGHQHASKASDIYAMGVVFYQALCGQFPYDTTGSPRDVLNRICTSQPPPPSKIAGRRMAMMLAMDAIVLKCLAKAPEQRYTSAAECADDIDAVIAGRRPRGTRVVVTRRRRAVECMVATVVVIGASLAYWFWPEPQEHYQLPSHQNNLGMAFVRIPAQGFFMGAQAHVIDWRPEEDGRLVRLTRDYWLGTTEVTRGQYAQVMGLPVGGDVNLPATNVSYRDAMEFCRLLGAREGRRYRLPTEAEWEFAAKSTNREGWDDKSISLLAWHGGNSRGTLHPVGLRRPNDWALYDMIGNAAEWCLDGWGSYQTLSTVDPVRSIEGADGEAVVRGGHYGSTRVGARTTARHHAPIGKGHGTIGFRVVMETQAPTTLP